MSDQTNERIAFFVFFGVSVLLFVIQLFKHFRNFHAPFLQRYFIRLLFLPVFYTFCAFVNFIEPDAVNITDIITSYYESYCLALFFNIIISSAGGMELAAKVLSGQLNMNSRFGRSNEADSQPADKSQQIVINEASLQQNAFTVEVKSNGSSHALTNHQSTVSPKANTSSTKGCDDLGHHSPMILNFHRAAACEQDNSAATAAAMKYLRRSRWFCYQVVVVKPFMSVLNVILVSVDGEGSNILMVPRVLGFLTIIFTLRTLYSLYKGLQPSGLLQKISSVQKLFWVKTQIGLEVTVAFILQTIANNATLPGPDDYDKYQRATRILALFSLFEAHLFLFLAFWILPADDPSIVEWENVMQLTNENKCAFCLSSTLLCDLTSIYAPEIRTQPPHTEHEVEQGPPI